MRVLAFHGQGGSGDRLRADMGDPSFVTEYPDIKRANPLSFSRRYLASHGNSPVVLIGYSLGGDFIAALTYTPLRQNIAGIVVYESPLKTVDAPFSFDIPTIMIWNDYEPRDEARFPFRWIANRRQAEKDATISAWRKRCNRLTELTGKYKSHILRSKERPFIRHAWDQSLNSEIERRILGMTA